MGTWMPTSAERTLTMSTTQVLDWLSQEWQTYYFGYIGTWLADLVMTKFIVLIAVFCVCVCVFEEKVAQIIKEVQAKHSYDATFLRCKPEGPLDKMEIFGILLIL